MKRLKWIFYVLSTLLIAAYLVYIPAYILEHMDADPYLEMRKKEPEPYTGVLTLWHIVGFKPSIGSVGNWLKEIGEGFGKRHFGIFIQVEAISLEECAARLARGERADLYSYPLGWGYAERFQEITAQLPDLLPGLSGCGADGGSLLSAPYLLSGYFFAYNYLLLVEQNVEIPEQADIAWIQETAERMCYTYGKKKSMRGLGGSAVLAAHLGIVTDFAPLEDFKVQNAAMALCDVRTIGELERAQLAGKGFYIQYQPISSFTDLVQLIGVDKNMEPEKYGYAMEFITMLYEEKSQAGLVELGLFPAVSLEEDVSYSSEGIQALYELLKNPVVPNAFLYQRYQEALLEEAKQALSGNGEAKASFDSRIKELVSGGKS